MQAMIWQYLSQNPEEAEAILSHADAADLAAAGMTGNSTAQDVDNGLVYMLTAAYQKCCQWLK